MSLINQMLRDLESRRAMPAPAAGAVAPLALAAARAAGAPPPAPVGTDGRMGISQRWLIAAILLLTVLLGLLLWSSQPPWQARVQESAPPAVAGLAEPVARVPVVAMTVEPAPPPAAGPVEPVRPVEFVAVAEPVEAAPPAAKEKTIAETPARPQPVETVAAMPPAVAEKAPTEPPSRPQSTVLSPEPTPPAQAPAADTLVNKRIRPLSDEQLAQQALRRGLGLLGEGRRAEAEQALREALRLDPRQLRARETLAALYLNNGRLSEAQVLLAEGLRLSPRAAALAQLYARLLAEQGDLAKALTVLQRASPPLTENPDYHALLAALYQRDGQHSSAAWVYRQLLTQRQPRAAWWLGLAISLEALDDSEPALEAYLRAHQLGAGLAPQVLAYVGRRIGVLTPRVAAMKQAAGAAKTGE